MNTEWPEGVLKELTCLREICSVTSKSFKKNHRMNIKIYYPKDAANAVAVLSECHSMDADGITVELAKKHLGSQCITALKVEWCRRLAKNEKKFCFCSF